MDTDNSAPRGFPALSYRQASRLLNVSHTELVDLVERGRLPLEAETGLILGDAVFDLARRWHEAACAASRRRTDAVAPGGLDIQGRSTQQAAAGTIKGRGAPTA